MVSQGAKACNKFHFPPLKLLVSPSALFSHGGASQLSDLNRTFGFLPLAKQELHFYSSSWSKAFLSQGFSKGAFVSPRGLSRRRCLIQVLWFLALVHHSSAIFTTHPFDFCPWPNLAMSCNFCSSSSSPSSLSFSLSRPSSSSSLSSFPSPPPKSSHWGFYFLMTTISTSARW